MHLKSRLATGAIVGSSLVLSGTAAAQTLDELAERVEQTSAEYNTAIAEQEKVDSHIAELDAEIADIESRLPDLETKVNAAAVIMYKDGENIDELLDLFLGSDNIVSAIESYQNYTAILECRARKVDELKQAKLAVENDKLALAESKAKADEIVAHAKAALDEATEARTSAQQAAIAQEAADKAAASSSSLAGDIDWTMPKEQFVEHWGARIDAYLAGSPLSGHGGEFADAAYRNGTDPRWSPAISLVESSKGSVCFRPYNAWGWMGHSFGSWSEAIYAHVEYLAGPLYGGYLTMSGASTYCPPGGPWYEKVAAEMRKI